MHDATIDQCADEQNTWLYNFIESSQKENALALLAEPESILWGGHHVLNGNYQGLTDNKIISKG